MKNQLLSVALIVLLGVLIVDCAEAQVVQDDWGVRVSWPANPARESVETYSVSWFDGGTTRWNVLGSVDHTDGATLTFTTRLKWMKSTLAVGDNICFRVIANRGSEVSEPSPNGCKVIEDLKPTGPVLPALSRPVAPTVTWEVKP